MIKKYDLFVESIRDKMVSKSKEDIDKIDGEVIVADGTYQPTKDELKKLIRKYSNELNKTLSTDKSDIDSVDFIYKWKYKNLSIDFFKNPRLTEYSILIYYSKGFHKNLVKSILSDPSHSTDLLRMKFYYPENAIKFLDECGIDISKIEI